MMDHPPLLDPESIPAAFVRAWNDRDPDGIAALFDDDADFVNVVGLWWHDRESIRRAHAYGLERIFNRSTLRLVRVKVKHLSDDAAIVHARMRLSDQTPLDDVEKPRPRHNVFTFVVHRTASGWICAAAHNTDVVPDAETNIVDESGRLMPVDYRRRGSES